MILQKKMIVKHIFVKQIKFIYSANNPTEKQTNKIQLISEKYPINMGVYYATFTY